MKKKGQIGYHPFRRVQNHPLSKPEAFTSGRYSSISSSFPHSMHHTNHPFPVFCGSTYFIHYNENNLSDTTGTVVDQTF